MKRILIAKKNDSLRHGIKWALNQGRYEFTTQARDKDAFIERIKETVFDLIIIDRSICKEIGIKKIREIKKQNEDILFIMMNPNGDIEERYKKQLKNVGFKAFIPTSPTTVLLISIVRKVFSGQKVKIPCKKTIL